jgi:hypothetical protein
MADTYTLADYANGLAVAVQLADDWLLLAESDALIGH